VPAEQDLLLVLVVAVLASVAVTATILSVPHLLARRGQTATRPPDREDEEQGGFAVQLVAGESGDAPEGKAGLSGAIYDRVVRVASYSFLIGTFSVVAISGLWQDAEVFVYGLAVIAALFVLIVHDVLPTSPLGSLKFALEGSAAIAFVTMLVTLTGGPDSPFFFGYLVIATGAALVVRVSTAFLVAVSTSVVYMIAMATYPDADLMTAGQLARVALNLVALWLLSYLAAEVGREQRRTRDAAVRLSLFDPLTQLYNRNYFFAVMEREIQRANRTRRGFCLLMLDLDGLKPVNDNFGHHYGDRILRAVADVIRKGVRGIDSAARYGGDEFVVILPETEPEGALVVAEKLRQAIAQIRVTGGQRNVRTSASIGVVTYPDDGTTSDQLLMSADAAMYESKRLGKNRVVDRHGGFATTMTNGAQPRGDDAAGGRRPTFGERWNEDTDDDPDDRDRGGRREAVVPEEGGGGSRRAPRAEERESGAGGSAAFGDDAVEPDPRYFRLVRAESEAQFDRGMRHLLGDDDERPRREASPRDAVNAADDAARAARRSRAERDRPA
jgi:diguanylate cyclase (GGDEF)-like protein